MNVASLPMYDMPEVRGALDTLWLRIARSLKRAGVTDVPDMLVHGVPTHDFWADPNLLLSQCCGFDIVKNFTRLLRPIATPRYGAPGCDGTLYSSVVIVRENSDAAAIEDLRGAACAVNGPDSHSGMNALRALVAPLSCGGRFFSSVTETGAHAASIALVASGKADVAAIDCVTYALLGRHRPAGLIGTRRLCYSASAPGIPYVTRVDTDDETAARLKDALLDTFADPALAAARDELFLDGIEVLPQSAYYDLIEFERHAIEHGYPKLR